MHLYKIRLKCLLRNKVLVFWTLLFPIVLALFFRMAFGNLNEAGFLATIPIAITEGNESNLKQAMEGAKFDGDTPMFSITMADDEEGNELLSNGTVSALIRVEPSQAITVKFKNGGLNETIVKAFLDQYLQTTSLVTKIMVESQGSIQLDDLLAQLATQEENIGHVGFGANNPDSMLSYFYALIGMALIYGGFWGTNELIDLQANLSPKGMRVSIGPTKRLKLLLTNLSAAYTIHLAEILLFLAFLVYGLGISFGDRPLLVVLICAIGSFVGISFGAFTTLLLKKASEGVKVAITTITGIFGGFLSGMMYANIKFWIMTTIPILTFINPVSPIADGLFSLYYFESLDRFYLNLGILLIMLVVFIVGMGLLFRRDDYESI